jgi:hypothetical protein
MYIQSYGKTNVTQASVQCPSSEERVDMEIQTDKTVKISRQIEAIGHRIFSDVEREKRKKRGGGSESSLNKFLKNAALVCGQLLEENEGRKKKIEGEKASIWKFSTNFTTFYHPITANRRVIDICVISGPEVAAVYGNDLTHEDSILKQRGLICVWTNKQPQLPSKYDYCVC